MENPATWGPVEKAIHDAYVKWQEASDAGIAGLSLEMTIANELRAQQLVVPIYD